MAKAKKKKKKIDKKKTIKKSGWKKKKGPTKQSCASIGFEDFVKKAINASFSMNTIRLECPNVGFLRIMENVPIPNVFFCTWSPRIKSKNALGTIADSAGTAQSADWDTSRELPAPIIWQDFASSGQSANLLSESIYLLIYLFFFRYLVWH